MNRRTWGTVGAVVVLAAAGTATALLLTGGGGGGDYKALPTCDKLSAAVPGAPPLKVGENVTEAADYRGLHLGYSSIQCGSGDTEVYVDLYEKGNADLITLKPYPDNAEHDGAWRANAMFTRATKSFDELKPGVRYGSTSYSNSTCTVMTMKRNATVSFTVRNPAVSAKATLEEWKAGCRQIAEKQAPKVVDAALG